MLTPNEAYQYDSTFRRVVDLMCAYLSEYEITPAELRQAAILAATMHEARHIKPLFISKRYGGMDFSEIRTEETTPYLLDFYKRYASQPPAMFGGPKTDAELNRTVLGALNKHAHVFCGTGRGYSVCECGISDVYYNWAYNKK